MSTSAAPSINSAHSNEQPHGFRAALSKTKEKAKATLSTGSPDKNASSISLGSTDGKSSTNLIDKLKQKRVDRKERKIREKNDYLDVDNRSAYDDGSGTDDEAIRRPSEVPSMNSEASVETYEDSDGPDDDEPITNQGFLTLDQPSQVSHHLTFPIVVSTSVEDPAHQPQTPSHLNPTELRSSRRSTSPGLSTSSRDASPTPSMITASPAANNILGGIFGIGNGKKRSGSTATRDTTMTDSSDKSTATTANTADLPGSTTPIIDSTPNITPIKTVNTSPRPDITATPPTPIDATHKGNAPPSQGTLSQRRGRNGSLGSMPSKLSQTQFAEDNKSKPLTPTIEVPTPAATPMVGQAAGGGFFGSMFAAAQNAASQLGSTINTSIAPGQVQPGKGKKLQPSPNINSGVSNETTEEATPPTEAEKERKRLAVETLGQGELNLASLGITMEDPKELPRGRASSRPNSAVYTDPDSIPATNIGLGVHTGDHDDVFGGTHDDEARTSGYATPPHVIDEGDNTLSGRRRSGSVRSAVGRASRRKRGSSAATNNIALPEGSAATKANGFAVATAKRNKDFHQLFRSVPENDLLIEDYGCALQKEILLQGRMYVSEGHICFNSNIFGWVTTLVISFDEVVSIEKKMTAVVFPNAIAIQTLHARNVFASFISRDSSYDLLVGIWRMSHPTLRTSANEARLDDGSREHGSGSGSESEDDYADDDDLSGEAESTVGSVSEVHEVEKVEPTTSNNSSNNKVASRKVSSGVPPTGAVEEKPSNGDAVAPVAGEGFPGPATHAPTTCGDETQHFEKPLCDEIITAPLGKVHAIIFGDQSHAWMSKFLVDEEKNFELTWQDEGKFKENSEYGNKKTRGYSYIKPLTGSIGPKQTKCIITEIIEQEDLNKAITILMETRTPDVPSGGMFKVMTRYCMTWAENNQTRFVMNCAIEWSGKSWLKSPIEKGANDGQTGFCKDILIALRREFSGAKPSAGAKGASGKRSGKRKATTSDQQAPTSTSATTASKQPATSSNPINAFLVDPLSDILGAPIAYAVSALIVGILSFILYKVGKSIFGGGRSGDSSSGRGIHRHTDTWNEMWMQEERGLWEWIEDRAGGGVNKLTEDYVDGQGTKKIKNSSKKKQQVDWEKKARDRQMDEAEERLRLLKKAVDERLQKLEGIKSSGLPDAGNTAPSVTAAASAVDGGAEELNKNKVKQKGKGKV